MARFIGWVVMGLGFGYVCSVVYRGIYKKNGMKVVLQKDAYYAAKKLAAIAEK